MFSKMDLELLNPILKYYEKDFLYLDYGYDIIQRKFKYWYSTVVIIKNISKTLFYSNLI